MNAHAIGRARVCVLATASLALALPAGCGGSKFPVVAVEGTVLLDGQPVPEAKVVFMPASVNRDGEAGPYSQGVTDAEGRFRLRTIEEGPRSGAVVGPHSVIVSTKRSRLDPNELDRVIIERHETIPLRYTHYKKTPLRFEVPSSGSDDAELSLQSARR